MHDVVRQAHAAATTSFGKPIVLAARLGHALSLDDFEVAARRQGWARCVCRGRDAGDAQGHLTYIAADEGWLYLAAVLDLHSPQVVGWDRTGQ